MFLWNGNIIKNVKLIFLNAIIGPISVIYNENLCMYVS